MRWTERCRCRLLLLYQPDDGGVVVVVVVVGIGPAGSVHRRHSWVGQNGDIGYRGIRIGNRDLGRGGNARGDAVGGGHSQRPCFIPLRHRNQCAAG